MSEGTLDALIWERALLGAIAALVPLPFVDDFLLGRARRALLREVAQRAHLALDDRALRVLAADRGRGVLRTVGVGAIARLARAAAVPVRVIGRARAALETLQVATLLDHYARAHHAGLDLDEARAQALRAAIDEASAAAPTGLRALRAPAAYMAALRAAFDTRWPARDAAG